MSPNDTAKRIDNVYIRLIGELCGESFYTTNSDNLKFCEMLHNYGGSGYYTWKTIYFALLKYSSWLNKKAKADRFASVLGDDMWNFKNNPYDKNNAQLIAFLDEVRKTESKYMTKEEFCVIHLHR